MFNMAKLNVVIPAVEVTVGGVTYRKVDRKAQAGDIVRAITDADDITNGAFYEVYVDAFGEPAFNDDVDDARPRQLSDYAERYEVYAPISEPAAETITFEGATWRKVDRDVREGDAIKFTDEDRSSYLTDAELYVVYEVDSCDDPQITDDDGDDYDAGSDDYEVYELVAEETAVEYREIKRKADVGERIRISNRVLSEDRYKNGDEFVVNDAGIDGDVRVPTEGSDYTLVLRREYVVLEPVTTKKAESTLPERPAVGDYARVVSTSGAFVPSYIVAGNIVKIAQDDESHRPFRAELTNGNNAGWYTESELVRATDEEVAAAKEPRSQFAVGDYAKVAVEYCEHNVGDVLKIDATASQHDFYVTNVATNRLGCIDADKLVKLTAAEIADIERKQAEEAAKRAEETKWNAIGRKVNEYKVGDIVEAKRRLGNSDVILGEVCDVRDEPGTYLAITSYVDGNYRSVDVLKLIVPVEQRFDRAEEVDAA